MKILEKLSLMAKAAAEPTIENKGYLIKLANDAILGCYASELYDELEDKDSNEYEILQTLEDAAYAARMNMLYE